MNLSNFLKKIDAYPKTVEEASIKTVGGAAVTIVSYTIMVFLLIMEFRSFITVDVSEDLFVDTTRGHKLKINLDISIPRISCDYVSLDAMDSSGEQHLHIDHNIFKRRLNYDGIPIEEGVKEDITTVKTVKNETTKEPVCGSCYGAEQNDRHCCNTCEDVLNAYRQLRWNPNPDDFEQCKNEKIGKEKAEAAFKEGCQIYGHMEVNRVGGSFHIAPGKSFSLNHLHIHDVQPFSSTSFNTSHKINHLSFGKRIEFANIHPLDGMEIIAKEGASMFQYYIKIVPTIYIKENNEIINTNQFSVTRHQKAFPSLGESGMPGIFFSYELSPLMVKYTEKRRSINHFLTNVIVIIGGIYVVAGMIDSLLHNHIIKQKIEIGKFS